MAKRSTLSKAQRRELEKKIKATGPKIDFSIPGRQPNGRPQASNSGAHARARDAKATTIKTRMRMFGVTAEQADSGLCGYPLGRLLLRGFITERWHEAGMAYARCAARYYAACQPSGPTPAAIRLAYVTEEKPDDPPRPFIPTPEDNLRLLHEWHEMERRPGTSLQSAMVYRLVVLDQDPPKDVWPLFGGLANLADALNLQIKGFEDSMSEAMAMMHRLERARAKGTLGISAS